MPLLLPNKYIRAAGTLPEGRGAVALDCLEMKDMLRTPHPGDAHMLLYEPETDGKVYPVRYKKRSGAADSLVTEWMAFDYDLPGHRAWDSAKEVQDVLERAREDCPDYYAIYTTTHGYRLVLRLPRRYPVRRVEALHKTLLTKFGVKYDKNCSDWTRAFRLPYVVRDGVCLWEEPLTELEVLGNLYDCDVPLVPDEKLVIAPAISRTAPGEEVKKLVWLDPG